MQIKHTKAKGFWGKFGDKYGVWDKYNLNKNYTCMGILVWLVEGEGPSLSHRPAVSGYTPIERHRQAWHGLSATGRA